MNRSRAFTTRLNLILAILYLGFSSTKIYAQEAIVVEIERSAWQQLPDGSASVALEENTNGNLVVNLVIESDGAISIIEIDCQQRRFRQLGYEGYVEELGSTSRIQYGPSLNEYWVSNLTPFQDEVVSFSCSQFGSSSRPLSTNVQDPTIKLCNQLGWKYYDHTNSESDIMVIGPQTGCSNNLSSAQPRSAIVNFHGCQDYNSTQQNPLTVCMQLFSGQGVLTNVFFIAQLGPEKEWSPNYFLRIADTSGVSCSLGGGSKREIRPQPPQDRNNDGLTDLVIDIQVEEICDSSPSQPQLFQLLFMNKGNTFSPAPETVKYLSEVDPFEFVGFEFNPTRD